MAFTIVKKTKELVKPVKAIPDKGSIKYKSMADSTSLYQSYHSGFEMAPLSEKGEQCIPFAYCKDYIQDVIWGTINKKSISIYGLDYDPTKNPLIDLEHLRLAVREKSTDKKDFFKQCQQALNFLNWFEEKLKMEPSKLFKTRSSGVFVFVADKNWMHAPPLISLYSLLLRMGMTYEGGDALKHFQEGPFLRSGDKAFGKSVMPVLEKKLFVKSREELFAKEQAKNYPADANSHCIHSSSGISAFANSGISSSVSKHWPQAASK